MPDGRKERRRAAFRSTAAARYRNWTSRTAIDVVRRSNSGMRIPCAAVRRDVSSAAARAGTRFEAARRSSRRPQPLSSAFSCAQGRFDATDERDAAFAAAVRMDVCARRGGVHAESVEDRATTPFTVTAPAGWRLDRSKLASKRSSMEPAIRAMFGKSHIPTSRRTGSTGPLR